MIKFRLTYLVILLTILIQSCEDSDNEPNNEITISISNFITNIDENPIAGASLGTVLATTNQGSINYSITQSSPNQSIQIDASTGEITVLAENLFDYEVNPVITGIVKVENSGVSDTANITINLNDIIEIVDDYNLLAISNLGEVFEIGNNTGNLEKVGQVERESNNSILSTNNLIASNNKIYCIEYIYNPSPTNNLLIFDRQNNTTQRVPLTLPSSIVGDERGIIALEWNNNNLIGVLGENVIINNFTKHIININLEDYIITDLGITFNEEDKITSMKKINSKLYLSTWGEGFLEIDLTNKSVNNINSINGSRLAQINESELAIMQYVPGFFNGAKPARIDLSNQTVSNNSDDEIYGLVTLSGNSIFKNQIYLNLVSTSNLYFGILKTNFETNESSIIEINSTSVDRNLIILDTTN
jgi:hypothetical protein